MLAQGRFEELWGWLRETGLRRDGDGVEAGAKAQALQYTVKTIVEIRDHAERKPVVFETLQDDRSFRVRNPVGWVRKKSKKPVKVCFEIGELAQPGENLSHQLPPPSALQPPQLAGPMSGPEGQSGRAVERAMEPG